MAASDAGRTNGDRLEIRRERLGIKGEIAVIPTWAFVLAAMIFVVIPVCLFWLVWPAQENAPRPPIQYLIAVLPATILAFLVLMIGYVNRDAARRGMSRTLWTLIVIFVPNAIGFILYFLLRNPIRVHCPKCETVVDIHINYCPHCRFSFHPICTQCKAAVRPGDAFCVKCGTELKQA